MKRGAPPPNFHHLSLNRWRSRLGRALLCAALLNSAVSPLPTKAQAGYYYDSDGDGAEEYYPDPWETDPGYSDSGYTDAAAGDNTSPGYFDYGDGTSGSGDQPTAPAGAGVGGWPSGGPDSDGDGLEDDFELTVSGSYLIASDLFYDPTTLVWENYEYWEPRVLDPNNVDSDSDGIPDGVEYLTLAPLAEALGGFVSFDPLDPTDGPADYDNDGLSNRLEVMAYGTDPFSWDSDQDGWFDSEEILLQTDPLNPADPGDSETPQSGDSGSGGANGGAAAPLPGSGSGEAAGESPVGGDTPESAATGTGGEAGAASGETAVSGEDPATTSVPRFLLRGGRLFYHTGEFVKSPVYWWYLDQNDNEGFDSGEPSRPSATPLPEGGYEGNPAAEGYRFLPEMSDSLAQTWFQDQNGNGRFDPPMEPSVLVIDPRTRGGGGPSGEQWFRNRAGGSERWHDGGPRETVHFTDGLSAVARYPELATRGEWRRFTEADKEAFQARAWWGAVEAPPVPSDFDGSLQEWNPDAPQVFDIDALATEIRWASQSPVMEDMEKTCLIEHGPLTAQAEPNHQQANIQAVTFFIKKGETVARVAAQGGSAGAGFSLTPTSVILNPPLESGRGHFARLLQVDVLQPLLDEHDEKVLDPGGNDLLGDAAEVRFSRWFECWESDSAISGDPTYNKNFLQEDRDRLVIRAPILKGAAVEAFLSTQDADGHVVDEETEVTIDDSGFTMLLVSNKADDFFDPARNNIRGRSDWTGYDLDPTDDDPGDPTHRGTLGGRLVVRIPAYGNATFKFPIMKAKRVVHPAVYYLKEPDESADWASITRGPNDFTTAREIYAQLGIELKFTTISKVLTPPQNTEIYDDDTPWDGEPEPNVAFSSTQTALWPAPVYSELPLVREAAAIPTKGAPFYHARNPTLVYVSSAIDLNKVQGDGYNPAGVAEKVDSAMFAGFAMVTLLHKDSTTLAHELGHLLGLDHSHDFSQWYLMRGKKIAAPGDNPLMSPLHFPKRDADWLLRHHPDRPGLTLAKSYLP